MDLVLDAVMVEGRVTDGGVAKPNSVSTQLLKSLALRLTVLLIMVSRKLMMKLVVGLYCLVIDFCWRLC